ncbi:MAG: hypothetical protein DRJ38_01595 [Thermoprotei archaeon]|nr:MAG: hypothetical protein DRJ38_01595 [Thermoprotei archaeon]
MRRWLDIRKLVFLIFSLYVLFIFSSIVSSVTNFHVHAYTPNYEDHTDITVKNIKIEGLEPNSTYKVTFNYIAQVQYSVYSENGYVAAGWFNTRFLHRNGVQLDKRETVSGTFSMTGYTGASNFLIFEVELWAEADGGELYSYDVAVIDVIAEVEISSIEKISDDGGDNGGGGGGGGGKKSKYSGLTVKAADQKGHILYHVPINVSGYREGVYKTPFTIFRKSVVDSSFSVVLVAPQKLVFGSKVRYFINWSLKPAWTYRTKWYQNNTIRVFIPDNAEYIATAYYGKRYYWYCLEVKSNIPVLISYEGNIGLGSKYTNFTLYRESPIDDGLTVILKAPEQVSYNGSLWFFDKWVYKIPIYSKEKELYDNIGEFSCPSQVANKGVVIAIYKRTVKLTVESYPIKGIPIQIWHDDLFMVDYTDFVLRNLSIGDIVSLRAPEHFAINDEEYYFSHWLVNGKRVSNELIEVFMTGDKRVVAYYYKKEWGGRREANLKGEWLIPGESINITLPYPGVYTIKVTPYYNISKRLTALVVANNASKYAYIDLDNLTLTTRVPFISKKGSMHVSIRELKNFPVIASGEYKGWYFLGASAWTPSVESSGINLDTIIFDEKHWVTYAVYNITVTWRDFDSFPIRKHYLKVESLNVKTWSKIIVITSLNFTLWSFYDRNGVYIVWEAYYRYLPPPELNLSLEPPHQDVWFTLEHGNDIVISQRLGKGRKYYGVGNGTVFSDAYLPYDYIIEEYGLNHLVFKARVRWSGPLGSPVNIVPFSKEKDIHLVPLCLKLLEIKEKPLHLVFKWTLFNKTPLPAYSRLFCPCVRIDVFTEWDGKLYENVGVKSKYDYTVYIVDLDVDITWPRRITIFFIHSRTKDLVLLVPSVKL